MQHLKQLDLVASFPRHQYPKILPNQREALEIIEQNLEQHRRLSILELPTGSGKTAVGYTFLRALAKKGAAPLFYITPTKTLVEQVKQLHPDVSVAYGRNEHPCLYFPGENLQADEIPCSLLVDCPHRVDQETGETHAAGAIPCPYLQQKYLAKQSKVVVCTTAFYLFTQLFSKEWKEPAGLVIDEAHRIAQIVRNALSYEVTDYHLKRSIELLKSIGAKEARYLRLFLRKMMTIVRRKPAYQPTLLEDREIGALIEVLEKIDPKELKEQIGAAIRKRDVDPKEQREVLKKIEVLVSDLRRYLNCLRYSLSTPDRNPLNYTYAFYKKEMGENEKVKYRLFIKSYYVAPLVRQLLSSRTVAYSATIGDPQVFAFESGIKGSFHSLPSGFPVENTRIFIPTDTPNLAVKERSRQEPARVLRRIAQACKQFATRDLRSLVVVISERERQKFLELASEEGLKVVSYGNGVPPKQAALNFKGGQGQVLVGTAANYGEGVDLPKSLAPVIFFLRPGYPNPKDPGTVFEERRWGGMRWGLWNWRVMLEALQVRGRNIRSTTDLGVTFFISQQFRRFVRATLPQTLQDAYRGQLTFEDCVQESMQLLASGSKET